MGGLHDGVCDDVCAHTRVYVCVRVCVCVCALMHQKALFPSNGQLLLEKTRSLTLLAHIRTYDKEDEEGRGGGGGGA